MLNVVKVRVYPNKEQREKLSIQFGCARWIYNWGLSETQRLYRETGKGLSYYDMANKLPTLKRNLEWLSLTDSQVLQQSLRNLSAACQNFFERRSRYPRFKKKTNKQSIQYPQRVDIIDSKIRLPKVGWVNAVIHRELVGKIKTVTVSKTPTNKYFASILLETEDILSIVNYDGSILGIDVGLTHLAITSDGSKFDNPRFLNKAQRNLKIKQQSLSRKKKGSKNREKARLLVAKAHEKIANQRQDWLHKVSDRLVNENQVIAVEDLHVKAIMKNRKLSKAISDVGWGMLTRFLKYKCERRGKVFIEVNRWYPSSKACSSCGKINESLKLNDRSWKCSCGVTHDRDINAACNIREEARRMIAAGIAASGGNVRRGRKSSVHANAEEARSA